MSTTMMPGPTVPMFTQPERASARSDRSNETVTIREAIGTDLESIYQMSRALALYERKSPEEILLTREKISKWAFGPNKVFSTLIALRGDQPIGMAVFYYAYAGSVGAPILYCEDLFVERLHRKRGVATLMMKELVARASQLGCCRVQGAVFNWNENAATYYEKLGAQIRRDLHQVRLDASKFKQLLDNPQVYV